MSAEHISPLSVPLQELTEPEVLFLQDGSTYPEENRYHIERALHTIQHAHNNAALRLVTTELEGLAMRAEGQGIDTETFVGLCNWVAENPKYFVDQPNIQKAA
jgi:hypothetical protein